MAKLFMCSQVFWFHRPRPNNAKVWWHECWMRPFVLEGVEISANICAGATTFPIFSSGRGYRVCRERESLVLLCNWRSHNSPDIIYIQRKQHVYVPWVVCRCAIYILLPPASQPACIRAVHAYIFISLCGGRRAGGVEPRRRLRQSWKVTRTASSGGADTREGLCASCNYIFLV